jgi:hypothetical protein
MNKIFLGLAGVALSTSVASATLLIDDFTSLGGGNVAQIGDPTACVGSGVNNTAQTGNANTMGNRTMTVGRSNSSGCVMLESNTIGSGSFLQYSSSAAASGTASVVWTAANPALSTSQLLGTTLLSFLFAFDNASPVDVSWEFCVNGAGGLACASRTVTYSSAFPAPPSVIVSWSLASFTNYAGLLNAIALGSVLQTAELGLVAGQGADVALDLIRFESPEPSSFVLLGSALVGVALLRRRRKV